MSGSSLDAIDFALVRFEVEGESIAHWELLHTHSEPLSPEWKTRLAHLPDAHLDTFLKADAELGRLIGTQCRAFLDKCGIVPDAIASHGHTILHHPGEGYTVQIGNPSFIALEAGCDVVSDFRSNDIAAGGQGAPLAPVAERYLFPGHDFYVNLGGIVNLSSFPKQGDVRAWDIAPANQLLNFLARKVGQPYDNGGMLARNGHSHEDLVRLLQVPLPLPLYQAFSLDNSWIQEKYVPLLEHSGEIIADKLASVTEFIARSIAAQIDGLYTRSADMQLFISGGGAHNTYLIERITDRIAPVRLVVPERVIIDFKEAMLMALCGMLRLLNKPNAFASVTGAKYSTVNGRITSARRMLKDN